MTEIFGVEKEQMRMWLCNRKIITAQESVVKPLTMQQVRAIHRALGYFKRNLVSQKLLDFLKVLKSSGFNMYFFHVISQSGIQLVALEDKMNVDSFRIDFKFKFHNNSTYLKVLNIAYVEAHRLNSFREI